MIARWLRHRPAATSPDAYDEEWVAFIRCSTSAPILAEMLKKA